MGFFSCFFKALYLRIFCVPAGRENTVFLTEKSFWGDICRHVDFQEKNS